MKENVQSIEEFFGLFEKIAGKFKWNLKFSYSRDCQRLRAVGESCFCPIEAIFKAWGAYTLTERWDDLTRNTIIDSADERRSTTWYDQKVRDRLLKICGLNE